MKASRSPSGLRRLSEESPLPMRALASILAMPFTRNESGSYAWPTAYDENPTADAWQALVDGLVWGLLHPNPGFAFQIKVFFLLCVIVAGAYGAATVSRRILYVQAALIYLAISSVLSALQARLETRLARYGGFMEARS